MRTRSRELLVHAASALALVAAAGCSSNNHNGGPDGGPDGGAAGNGTLGTATPAAKDGSKFAVPLDAAPSPDGTTIYFVGAQPGDSPGGPGVFKVAAAGGAITALAVGGNLGSPLGIAVSTDGSTLYLADPAAGDSVKDSGGIYSLSSGTAGTPALLAGTDGYSPRAVSVAAVGGSDNIYFIGNDPITGNAGIFKSAGSTVSSVLGAGAGDIASITVGGDGTVYVLNGSGTVGKLAPGGAAVTPIGSASLNLNVGFPAGLALAQDESALLVAAIDPATGGESIARIDVASGAITQTALGLGMNSEPGGLHRAANADVYSLVDTGAGSSGTVYLLTK